MLNTELVVKKGENLMFFSCPVLLLFPVRNFCALVSETWTPKWSIVCIVNSSLLGILQTSCLSVALQTFNNYRKKK